LPPQAKQQPVPTVTYLAGLTCNEETFAIQGGARSALPPSSAWPW